MNCRKASTHAAIFVSDVQVSNWSSHAHKNVAFFRHSLRLSREEPLHWKPPTELASALIENGTLSVLVV